MMTGMRRVTLLLILALLATSLALAPGGTTAAPSPIATAAGALRQSDGTPFFLLGANYVGAPDRSWTMWQDELFDLGLIERDFLRARAAGLNTLRLFVRPPLQRQLLAGRWDKLDAVIALAERLDLYLIVTLYDYREDDLSKVATLNGAVARRYAGKSTILAYDFKNEPHFQDLAIAIYPGSRPPLQTDALIKRYGQRVSPEEADAWRRFGEGKDLVPSRFSAEEAYVYANTYRYYQEFVKEAGDWVTARNYQVSLIDYVTSADAAKWRPLLDVLDQTLAAWLRPQADAVRSADRAHLLTVGYSDLALASLPTAAGMLDFISFHRFPAASATALGVALDALGDLRRVFPEKPVVFEEYGYSNSEVDVARSAAYETAIALGLLSQGLGGGAKWSLNDVADGWNPRENRFGLYRVDGSAKPVAYAMRALGDYLSASGRPTGVLNYQAETGSLGLRYTYSAPDALFVAGQGYADPAGRVRFEAGAGQLFVAWPRPNQVDVLATVSGTLHLDPGALVGLRGVRDVSLARSDGTAVPFQRGDMAPAPSDGLGRGDMVSFAVEAGELYHLRFSGAAVDARIEIVWPHDGLPVSQAMKANVGAYLFEQGSAVAVCGTPAPTVRLWRALNNGVEEPVAVGEIRTANVGGLAFPAWDFNDVDVSAARDAHNKYYFRLSLDGLRYGSSIWSHGADARTYMPNQDTPSGVATAAPPAVDAKIEIVWPHDGLPVAKATKANIGVLLFERGTLRAAPPDWAPTVRLWRALNNGYEEQVAVGMKVIKRVGDLTFPAWEFNDVDVSAARDTLNKYYFRVTVDGVDSRGNVWSHGSDARTYFPQQDVPAGVGACN
ncbi:MAG: glycoside hydrolase family 5 protein [Chloroflexi bacterium]|nr:glycoside hydrolase family 5 protein [Chloroflexota bacterium]